MNSAFGSDFVDFDVFVLATCAKTSNDIIAQNGKLYRSCQSFVMVFCWRWVHKAESGRPNNRKPEGQILLTIRPNRKAKFDCKAKNIGSLISAQYINIYIEQELLYLIIWPYGKIRPSRLLSFRPYGKKFSLSVFL